MTKTITISVVAQAKMALHAAKHGFSNPIHGIVLGKTSAADDDGGLRLDVADVVPVCHEVPTKPIVDTALRLVDAHLQRRRAKGEEGEAATSRIVGWYTANANANAASAVDGDEEGETPNAPARRVASSVAECARDDGDGDGGGFVLLLVSAPRVVECFRGATGASPGPNASPACTAFERDHSRTFAQRVDGGRVTTSRRIGAGAVEDDDVLGVLSKAMRQLASESGIHGGDAAGGGTKDSIAIYDYVDHLTDCGKGDWIENRLVDDFVSDSFR